MKGHPTMVSAMCGCKYRGNGGFIRVYCVFYVFCGGLIKVDFVVYLGQEVCSEAPFTSDMSK